MLGQENLVDDSPSIAPGGLFWPASVAYDGTYLWLGEYKFSARILRFSGELVQGTRGHPLSVDGVDTVSGVSSVAFNPAGAALRVALDEVLSVKDRIDVEGSEHLRCVYHRLRSPTEGLIGWVKGWLGFRWLTWRGLDNVCIHVCLVLMVAYDVCIVAHRLGGSELCQSVAYFA